MENVLVFCFKDTHNLVAALLQTPYFMAASSSAHLVTVFTAKHNEGIALQHCLSLSLSLTITHISREQYYTAGFLLVAYRGCNDSNFSLNQQKSQHLT